MMKFLNKLLHFNHHFTSFLHTSCRPVIIILLLLNDFIVTSTESFDHQFNYPYSPSSPNSANPFDHSTYNQITSRPNHQMIEFDRPDNPHRNSFNDSKRIDPFNQRIDLEQISSFMNQKPFDLVNHKSKARRKAGYADYEDQIRSNLHSSIGKFSNRKYKSDHYRRREDRPIDETTKEKYNGEEDDSTNAKKSDSDYDEMSKTNKDGRSPADEEGRQANEKTDYDSPDSDYKGRQTKLDNDARDYDTKVEDEHLAEDEIAKEDSVDDDKLKDDMDDRFKDDDSFHSTDKEDEYDLNSLRHQSEVKDSLKNDVALRFSPTTPAYSRPFTPSDKLEYNSIDDSIANMKDASKDSPMGSSLDDKKDDLKDELKDNSKEEVNYSIYDLNRINSPTEKRNSDLRTYEKHEELLIELLKKRFLNDQKRLLEQKKQEQRKQFLNEIVDDSFSLRKLESQAVKYAMLEKKLNRLINLIQEQQKNRDLSRFHHYPTNQPRDFLGTFNSFLGADQLDSQALEQRLKSNKKNRLHLKPLFGPDAHFYPTNRFSFYRPTKSYANNNVNSNRNHSPEHRSPEQNQLNWFNDYLASNPSGYVNSNPSGYANSNPSGYANINPPNYQTTTRYPPTNYPSGYVSNNPPDYASSNPANYQTTTRYPPTRYPSNYQMPMYPDYTVKRYPIYKKIKSNQSPDQPVKPTSNQFSERLVNGFSFNNLSLKSNLFGGGGAKQTGLFSSILQPTEPNSFRKLNSLSPIKYQYNLLHNLQPSIPLRVFTNEKPNKVVRSLPQLGGIVFKGAGYSPSS